MITVGIDEVGRGCWAGPLVAGAVVLKAPIPGLRDSKKLTPMQRKRLAVVIHDEALAVGLGWVWPEEIDISGITTAVKRAMERALAEITLPYQKLIIDGNINYFLSDPRAEAVIKANDLVPSVSAASIVAKVARDNYMRQQAVLFPEYGFDKHVGYGTKQHIESLRTHGVTKLHRKSYKPVRALL